MMSILDELSQAVIRGDAVTVKELTEKALAQALTPERVFQEALILGMDEVGRRMEAEEYYIPEVLLSVRAMKAASEILKPLIAESKTLKPLGRVVIGTVQGDLHDIGKNLVAMMLEAKGFQLVDLGFDVSPGKFIENVKSNKADILAMSTLLTTTMPKIGETIEALRTAGSRESVIVMVGGAPVTDDYSRNIGADAFASDAAGAARLAEKLITERVKP
jgi:5-methyltetrahydrofolate--homocysteine methyltransferase